jgi:hypothetical protein
MTDTTPNLIDTKSFNNQVRGWTVKVRSRMKNNAPSSDRVSGDKLKNALSYKLIHAAKEPEVDRIKFQFPRHGVFVHYGVGRGYARVGNSVVKVSRTGESARGGIKRTPKDWFDVEIRSGLRDLAIIAQEYYGDWALDDMLQKMEKFTIQKRK